MSIFTHGFSHEYTHLSHGLPRVMTSLIEDGVWGWCGCKKGELVARTTSSWLSWLLWLVAVDAREEPMLTKHLCWRR
jgi:hypothetical protein